MEQSINETVFDEFPELKSERLCFREYKKDDAQSLFYIRSHPEVSKYMDSDIPLTNLDAEKRIESILKAFADKEGITWAIIDKESNAHIGDFGIWRIDRKNFRGEIGYILNPDY